MSPLFGWTITPLAVLPRVFFMPHLCKYNKAYFALIIKKNVLFFEEIVVISCVYAKIVVNLQPILICVNTRALELRLM